MSKEILERLTKLEDKINKIQIHTEKMSAHIDHINSLQEALKPTIEYFKNLKLFNNK